MAATSRVLGTLQEFDPKSDNISTYLERLQLYFEANGVEDDHKVAVLLTVIGARAYNTLRSLLAPELPHDTSFDDLLEALKHHCDPQPLIIAERFRFYQRFQKTDESLTDFVADFRRLSIKCDFGEFVDQALRDRFVCGVRSEAIQKKLLAEADLTIKRAQEIVQGMESADKNAKDLKGAMDVSTRASESVNLATAVTSPKEKGREQKRPCCHYGRRHDEKQCKFKDAHCHRCGKPGHIVPVCRSASPPPDHRPRKSGTKFKQRKRVGRTKWVDADLEGDSDALPMFVLQDDIPQPPITVTLKLRGIPVEMELDTGASL